MSLCSQPGQLAAMEFHRVVVITGNDLSCSWHRGDSFLSSLPFSAVAMAETPSVFQLIIGSLQVQQ